MDKVLRLNFERYVKQCWRPDIFVCDLTLGRFGDIPKEYTYIILGKPGPTGKTYLATELKRRGFNAFEITEDIMYLVEYKSDRNHYIINHENKTVVMVLNSPLD